MLSFSQFITERKRTPERANKLGSYLAKRHSGGSLITLHHDKHTSDHVFNKLVDHGEASGDKYLHKVFAKEKTQKVKISDLHSTQGNVAWKEHMGKHKLKDRESIEVVHYKGKHYIMNGHHRVIAHKLLGKTHINAKVVHLKDD